MKRILINTKQPANQLVPTKSGQQYGMIIPTVQLKIDLPLTQPYLVKPVMLVTLGQRWLVTGATWYYPGGICHQFLQEITIYGQLYVHPTLLAYF